MIGHTVTDDLRINLSFPFPPMPEHSVLFYPYDKPTVEDVVTKQVKTVHACTVTGPQTERIVLSLGRNHLMIKIGFQPGALYRFMRGPIQRLLLYKPYDGEAIFGLPSEDRDCRFGLWHTLLKIDC